MAGIMDLLRGSAGGMDQFMTNPMPNLPAGMPGAGMLNRPAGPDIASLIQMLMQGGGGGLPPLDQGAMMSQLGMGRPMPPMPPEIAAMLQPKPEPRKAPSNKPKINGDSPGASDKKKKAKSPKNKMADDMIAADRAGSAVSKFVRK